MLSRLLHTEWDYTLTWMRVVAGSVMFAHGAQKVLGWYGGSGYDATMKGFLSMGIPEPLAVVAILTGFCSRPRARGRAAGCRLRRSALRSKRSSRSRWCIYRTGFS